LLVDDGLVSTTALQVVIADQFHVALFRPLLRGPDGAQDSDRPHHRQQSQNLHVKPPFLIVLAVVFSCSNDTATDTEDIERISHRGTEPRSLVRTTGKLDAHRPASQAVRVERSVAQ